MGETERRGRITLIAATACLVFASASADAATRVGETFDPTGNCSPRTRIQLTSVANAYTVPTAGVLTSWSFQRDETGSSPVTLKVARDAGGGDFTIVGGSEPENPVVGLNTYPIRIPVQAGDVLGLHTAPASVFYCSGSAIGFTMGVGPFGSEVLTGSTATFAPAADQRLDVAAMLEPDCDADGFGDETQDGDTNSCPPGPQVTITKAPKDRVKTKRKRKRATFEFTANEPASFECALDAAPFTLCTSPHQVVVRRGKHQFLVRAIDAGANAGAPAIDSWKVKRKRRK